MYWASQLLGAAAAALILRDISARQTPVPRRRRTPSWRRTTDGKAVVFELILTFFLVWAVWATAVDPRGAFKAIAGLAIGLTITIDVFVGGSSRAPR